jgi:hypothetical protein
VLIVIAVTAGAVAVPIASQARSRASGAPEHAHSEVVVTESAAGELLHGRDPYTARFTSTELAGRDPSIRAHFPYLPGMAAFGMPHALAPATAWTDARIFFALVTLAAALAALAWWRAPPEHRLLAFQVLVALPSGALLLGTGGDDVPLLALCLLALVLAGRGRPLGAACAMAVAALLKLTAWPLLLALALAVPALRRPRGVRAPLTRAVAIVAAGLLPAIVAAPAAFADDVILFPLGLTTPRTPAAGTSLGSLVVTLLPESAHARAAVTAVLMATGLLIAAALARAVASRADARDAVARAAAAAGLLFATLVTLAPAGRPGYLVYPLNLLLWGLLLRERPVPLAAAAAPRLLPAREAAL